MDILELFREREYESRKHTQVMYVAALQHAINLIEIDPIVGLATLKDRLALEEKELNRIKSEARND